MQNIRWAVLGTGVIANEMAVVLKKNGRNIDAVGNRTHEKAVEFAEKYGIKKVYDNYNDMFTDPDIDVIYITTPHNTHIDFMRRAIENGKHILVEKSITLNSRELDEAIDLADKKGVVIGEAMTIYHMPIYKKLKEILESGKLGKVNLITMNFGSFKEYDMNNRFFNKNLAGGAMLDIGVYALSFIRWFMDSKPDQLLSQVKPAPTGVDEQAGLLLMNQEGQMASVMLSLHSKQPKRGMVSCEKGYIEIMEYPRAWEARITYTDSGETEVIQTGEYADALAKTYPGSEGLPGVAAENDEKLREEVAVLRKEYGHAMNAFLAPFYQGEAFKAGSTDVGDVSWLTPTAQIHVAAWPNGCPGHSWQNVSCDCTEIGHKAAVHAGKVLAASAVELFLHPEILEEARKEFEKRTAEGYTCPIPADAVPVIPD